MWKFPVTDERGKIICNVDPYTALFLLLLVLLKYVYRAVILLLKYLYRAVILSNSRASAIDKIEELDIVGTTI